MIEARKRAYRVAKPRAPGLKRVGNDESHLLRIARHACGMCITCTKHLSFPKSYPDVLMVQSSQDRNGDNGARALDRTMQGRIFL